MGEFLDLAAQTAFESQTVQQSWRVHLQAFGPILEPAFASDPQSRIDLTDALNRLSRQDLQGAMDRLRPLQQRCETDADCAAWLFFVGMCFELAGDTENMVQFYTRAGEFGHRFYLPYAKLARLYYESREFEGAEANFRLAMECLDPAGELRQKMTLAGLESNLARCLLAMHRYDEALALLERVEEAFPKMKGVTDTRAMVYAAMGDEAHCAEALDRLRAGDAEAAGPVERAARAILDGTDSHYRVLPADEDRLAAFWPWFCSQESKLRREDPEMLRQQLMQKLRPVFPDAAGTDVAVRETETGRTVELATGCSRTLEAGLARLLALRPAELEPDWSFELHA